MTPKHNPFLPWPGALIAPVAGPRPLCRRRRRVLMPNPLLGRGLLTGAAATAALAGLLTLVAVSHATTTTVEAPGAFVHQGAYAYSARVAPNALYPSGRLTT